jgi:hypothetical protein
MTDARAPWNEVGDRLGALALKLKLHAQEELSEERKAEAQSAVERFGATIQGAIDGIGDAARDPAVKEDAKAAGQALSTAVSATVDEVLKAFRPSPAGTAEPADDSAGSSSTADPDHTKDS